GGIKDYEDECMKNTHKKQEVARLYYRLHRFFYGDYKYRELAARIIDVVNWSYKKDLLGILFGALFPAIGILCVLVVTAICQDPLVGLGGAFVVVVLNAVRLRRRSKRIREANRQNVKPDG
ncbi:MAG: hypothetical protein J7M40_01235, partial [Planctomycetes bacterium]|nr:hypothetical protein [Planctomycetota bacterium]